MKKHSVLFAMIAISSLACGKLLKKDDRSSGSDAAAAVEDTAASGDATVAADAATTSETKIDKTTAALNGKELYAKLCASCHQALDNSDVAKAPLAKIQSAIQKESDMTSLKATTETDLVAIAEALKTISKGKGNGAEEGEDD